MVILAGEAGMGKTRLSAEAFRRVRDWLAEQKLTVEEQRLTLKGYPQPVMAYRLRSPEPVSNSTGKV